MNPKSTVLTAYNGTKIKQYGSILIPCSFKDSAWSPAEFYVVESNGLAILGLASSHKMKLVTINCAINTEKVVPINNKMDLESKYPDCFKGIGRFRANPR